MPNRGSVDWLGNIIYSDTDLADMRAESEAKNDQCVERRIAELERQVQELMAIVRPTRVEVELVTGHHCGPQVIR